MPAFLEKKLKAEYGDNKHAIYGTLNKIGAMHGNKETAKGRSMEKKHLAKSRALKHRMMGHVKNMESLRKVKSHQREY